MIDTQYGKLTDTGIAIKPLAVMENTKNTASNAENLEAETSHKRDVFEYSALDSIHTYTPETIKTGLNTTGVAASSSVSYATTNAQKKIIPSLLAAKMAGITTTYSDGSPLLKTWADQNAFANAKKIINGDHANLTYKKEYCYVQNVSGSAYGLSDPQHACAAFAFATALSIKNGRMITPADVKTDGINIISEVSLGDDVREWRTTVGETGYRIADSEGAETLEGINAQLQLGNPAIVHVSGNKNSDGTTRQHWVTVIGKKGNDYTVIDPWDGQKKSLQSVIDYHGSVKDYAIISDEY